MQIWLKEKKGDITIKYILFLISPFFAFVYSLRRINTRSSYFTFFFTAIFFSIAFSIPSGKGIEGGLDAQVYRAKFENFQNTNLTDFTNNLLDFLYFDDGKKDYYFDTIAFYISRITDNYHVMFMVFAIVFSYYSLKSLRFLTTEEKFDSSITSYILLYLFTYNQIFNINGMRFWTASWIAVYCIFQIYRNNNKKYFLLALLTPYFHGSYWIFLAVLMIAQLSKRFEKSWKIIFIISFFTKTFSLEFIEYFQQYLPAFLSNLSDKYTNIEAFEEISNQSGWIRTIKNIVFLYLFLIIMFFIKNEKTITSNLKTKNLYLFLLVWVSIFNFFMFIPSLGNRYIIISYPIISYIWLVNFKNTKYNKIIFLLPLVFLWNIIEQIIYYNIVISYDFYFSSPFYLIYKYILNN
ncbi:MAG: hypothetical protein GX765_06300 [Candidatus Moranbacteria bacterium]|nr:hypothetical protein [Candidatus Moranbacteria bacterium]